MDYEGRDGPVWPVGVAVGLLAGGGFLAGAAVASACWLIAGKGC